MMSRRSLRKLVPLVKNFKLCIWVASRGQMKPKLPERKSEDQQIDHGYAPEPDYLRSGPEQEGRAPNKSPRVRLEPLLPKKPGRNKKKRAGHEVDHKCGHIPGWEVISVLEQASQTKYTRHCVKRQEKAVDHVHPRTDLPAFAHTGPCSLAPDRTRNPEPLYASASGSSRTGSPSRPSGAPREAVYPSRSDPREAVYPSRSDRRPRRAPVRQDSP